MKLVDFLPYGIVKKRLKRQDVDPVLKAAIEVIANDKIEELLPTKHLVKGAVVTPLRPDEVVPYEKLREVGKYIPVPMSPDEERANAIRQSHGLR